MWNCEREDGFNSSVDSSSLKSYRIDKKEIPSIMGFINNSKAKTSFSCGNIDDNLIYTTIDSLGIQTYSFPFYVEETSEDTFYNFVVKTSSETVYQPFVFKYIASNGFEVGVDDFNTFEGALEIYHYDRFCGNGNTTGRTDDDSPCPTNTVGLYSGSGSNSAPGNNSNSSENNGPTGEDYYNNSGNTGASGFGSSTGGGGAIPCVVRVTWSCDTESSAPHSSANCSTVSVYCPTSYNRTDDPCEQQEDFSGATAVNNTKSCPEGQVQNSDGICVDECKTSKDDLKELFPDTDDAKLTEIADAINEHGKDFGIDTKEKLQHFLAQAGHESANFTDFTENLNYRVNKLGIDYWIDKFNPYTSYTTPPTTTIDPDKENPNDYASATSTIYVDNEDFANYVYDDANREIGYKLGNTAVGDGYKYRGRGIFQLTGKNNYTDFNNFYQDNYEDTDLLANPDLLASDTEIAVISALWFYEKNVLDKLTIDSNTEVLTVTEKVNGGNNGLAEREEIFEDCEEHIDCVE